MADRLTGFDTPTFDELLRAAKDHYAAELGTNPQLRRGVATALSFTDAMLIAGLYGYLDWTAAQTLPLWAAGANLDAWGRMFGIPRKGAFRASGTATATGEAGVVIPAGALLAPPSSDDLHYRVQIAATIEDGTAVLQLAAVAAGSRGNRDAGEKLTFVESIAGVDPQAIVIAMSGGAEAEADGAPDAAEAYRGRILARLREPPQGGSVSDHIQWVLGTPDVAATRVWVTPATADSNVVWVRFMTDGATEDGIPSDVDVAAVAIWLDAKKPVTEMDLRVTAPLPDPLDITIYGLFPDDAPVRAAIKAELADMILRRGYPGCTIYPAWVEEAISVAAGEDRHEGTNIQTPISYDVGVIPVLGEIAYA
ncbi:tail protein [Alphaproteobacteria bacterium]|nr:tail protein [Alphaproteobacteria bacterium]